MLVADAQVHIWAPNTPERPWRTEEPPHRATPIGADDLLRQMDAAGVQRALLVPPYWDAYRSDLALEAARLHPQRFAVIGRPDTETAETRRLIAAWRRQPGMLGMRCSFTRPRHSAILLEGRLDWLREGAEKAGVPVMVNVPHANLHAIDTVAARFPASRSQSTIWEFPKAERTPPRSRIWTNCWRSRSGPTSRPPRCRTFPTTRIRIAGCIPGCTASAMPSAPDAYSEAAICRGPRRWS